MIATPPTADFVRSGFMRDLMNRYVDADPGFDEAHRQTKSYRFRHSQEMRELLGVWRWRGLYDHRENILPLLGDGTKILDHGGAACPLGLDSDIAESDQAIVDRLKQPSKYDVAFSSHTLEHCDCAIRTCSLLTAALKPGGVLILHVPAWTAPHWHAGTRRTNDAIHGPHLHNFYAEHDTVAMVQCPHPATMIPRGIYVGDNSILSIWRKPSSPRSFP